MNTAIQGQSITLKDTNMNKKTINRKKAPATICQIEGGYAIKVNGQHVVSTLGIPFRSRECAQKGIYRYLYVKDPRFFCSDSPAALVESARHKESIPVMKAKQPKHTAAEAIAPEGVDYLEARVTDECASLESIYGKEAC